MVALPILVHLVILVYLTNWGMRYDLVMAADIPLEPGIGEAKAHLSEYVNRAIYRGDMVWIAKNNRRVAALIPADLAEWLEANVDAVRRQMALPQADSD